MRKDLRLPVAAMVISMVLVAGLVLRTSSAAFSDTTRNPGSSWAAGTVRLSDDDGGATALFNASGMVPGDRIEKCIAVRYTGNVTPARVRLYGAFAGGTNLSDYLDLTVERGSGGSFGSCSGFTATETAYTGSLASFVPSHRDFATGVGTWSPASGETQTYRFVVELRNDNAAQGRSEQVNFTWEAQST